MQNPGFVEADFPHVRSHGPCSSIALNDSVSMAHIIATELLGMPVAIRGLLTLNLTLALIWWLSQAWFHSLAGGSTIQTL